MFSSRAGHRSFSEGSCHEWNPRPLELRCLLATVTMLWLQKMSTGSSSFSCPPLVSGGKQSLRTSWLPGLWNRVECAWIGRKGLESPYVFPLKHPTNSPVDGTLLRMLRCLEAALSGRRLELGSPAPGEVEANWILTWNSSGPWCHAGHLSQPDVAHSRPLNSVQQGTPC